jgi:hypothetical protein
MKPYAYVLNAAYDLSLQGACMQIECLLERPAM